MPTGETRRNCRKVRILASPLLALWVIRAAMAECPPPDSRGRRCAIEDSGRVRDTSAEGRRAQCARRRAGPGGARHRSRAPGGGNSGFDLPVGPAVGQERAFFGGRRRRPANTADGRPASFSDSTLRRHPGTDSLRRPPKASSSPAVRRGLGPDSTADEDDARRATGVPICRAGTVRDLPAAVLVGDALDAEGSSETGTGSPSSAKPYPGLTPPPQRRAIRAASRASGAYRIALRPGVYSVSIGAGAIARLYPTSVRVPANAGGG